MIAIEKKQLCYFSTLCAEISFLVGRDCFIKTPGAIIKIIKEIKRLR